MIDDQTDVEMIKAVVQYVKLQVGQQRFDVLPGKQQLEFMGTHVDHKALQAAQVVTGKAHLTGSVDTAADFLNNGRTCAVTDNHRLAFIPDDLGF